MEIDAMMQLIATQRRRNSTPTNPAPTSWVVTNRLNDPVTYTETVGGGGWSHDGATSPDYSDTISNVGWVELTYPSAVTITTVYVQYSTAVRFGTISALNNGVWTDIATGLATLSLQTYNVASMGLTSVTKLRINNAAGHIPVNGTRLAVGEFYAV